MPRAEAIAVLGSQPGPRGMLKQSSTASLPSTGVLPPQYSLPLLMLSRVCRFPIHIFPGIERVDLAVSGG